MARTDAAGRQHERLERLKAECAEALRRLDLAAEGDERGDGHHHPAEVATDAERRERELREQLRWRERAGRISAAEERLAEGTWALCTDCGGTIPEERFQAVPDTVRCMPCQRMAARRR